jgi:SAM-dependent methyltransferase
MNIFQKITLARQLMRLLVDSHATTLSLPIVRNIEDYLSAREFASFESEDTRTLDLGCGTRPKNPFKASRVFGIDIRASNDDRIKSADLTQEPIPFNDCSFNYITAYDFLEHVPRVIYSPGRKFPFVDLMSEIWRVLKPNGIFLSHTPIYPFSACFGDPTHVNALTQETFTLYFDSETGLAKMYGFRGSFDVVDQVRGGSHLISVLRRVELVNPP